MKFNYKKIFGIIISSTALGLVFNYFNPEGIPLIREKLELKWAPDSLFLDLNENTPAAPKDSIAQNNSLKEQQQTVIDESKEKLQAEPKKIKEEIKEVIAFTEPKAITLEQAYTLFIKKVKFIDSRDEADYLAGHITNSINIPFDDFDNHKQKLEKISKEKPLVIYCAGTDCDLSHLLANILFSQGYKQVYVFFGGWDDWVNANYPIEIPAE